MAMFGSSWTEDSEDTKIGPMASWLKEDSEYAIIATETTKNTNKKMAKEFSFNDLDEQLTKINPKGSLISNNSYSRIDEWISSGNYLLNAQLSGSLFGGIPNSRSICLAGESGTGKTFLALNICREAQDMGYSIIYCDSEAAVDQDVIQNFGVDPDKFRYQPVSTPLEIRQFVAHLCDQLKKAKDAGKSLPKIMLVLDSLGNLATTKERSDAISGSDKRDMTKQQELRSLFRVITSDLAELKIPFVFTNHTYATIGSYVPGQTISGGGGAIYNASVILQLSKAGLKEDGTNKTGIIVTSKPAKNRFARPLPIKFHISFYKGMNPYVGLEQFLSWENCGVQRGKLITEKEFLKYYKEENPKYAEVKSTEFEKVNTETGEIEKLYLEAKETSRTIAVRHLADVVKPQELFSSKVFTQEMLKELDEKFIQNMFKLPNISTLGDIENEEISDLIHEDEN